MNSQQEVMEAFTPSAKLSEEQRIAVMKIENACKDLGTDIIKLVPGCADRAHALRQLLAVKMWCNQAITHPIKEVARGSQNQQNSQAQQAPRS